MNEKELCRKDVYEGRSLLKKKKGRIEGKEDRREEGREGREGGL